MKVNKELFEKKENKIIALLGLFLLCVFIVSYGTYAWFSSSETVTNKFQGDRLSAELTEVFDSPMSWGASDTTVKEVRVQNSGTMPLLARISLYESMLSFKIDVTDQTGNGNLITVSEAKEPQVNSEDSGTWEKAAVARGTYKQGEKYYVANKANVATIQNKKNQYKLNDTIRETSDFSFADLKFSAAVTEEPKPTGENYWLYEDGFFYYSQILHPGEISEPLLEKVTLDVAMPNRLKGALYQLTPYMEAHDLTKVLTTEWQIKESSRAYQIYKDYLKQ